MYKIIGADQTEYGPVTAEELKRWIAQGRANARTLAQVQGSAEWVPLGTLPEFAASFTTIPEPPPGQGPGPGYTYTPYRPSPVIQGAGREGGTNGMAVAGLVFSILGLLCCPGLFSTLGLIFSGIAFSQSNRSPTQSGRNLALAGIILSLLGFLLCAGLLGSGAFRPGVRRYYDL